MTGFRKISRNVDFWPKMAIFLPKRAKTAKTGLEVIGQKHSKTAILAKNGQTLALKGPKFRLTRIFPAYRV